MSIKTLLSRFTVTYVALLALVAITLFLLNAKTDPGTSTGALVGAVLLVCNQFAAKNKRYFTAAEEKNVIVAMCLINILLQTLATLIIGIVQPPLGTLLMLSILIGLLHSAVIYYIVGLAGRQYAKQA